MRLASCVVLKSNCLQFETDTSPFYLFESTSIRDGRFTLTKSLVECWLVPTLNVTSLVLVRHINDIEVYNGP